MIKKVLHVIEWSMFAVIILLCGILFLSNYQKNFPLKAFTVLTGSMEPTLPTGSMVFATAVKESDIRVGTIITFQSPDDSHKQIVHRIAALSQSDGQIYIQTKGDNNNAVDQWKVYPPQINGQVRFYVPYLGYLNRYSKTPLGFLAIVGIPALIAILSYCFHILRGIREYADHKAKLAVGNYIKSERKAETLHQMLAIFGLCLIVPVGYAHALLKSEVTANQVTFTTADFAAPTPSSSPTPTPTSSPLPTATPTIQPSATPTAKPSPFIQLHQSGAQNSINVNATTTGGSQTIIIQNNQSTTQSQSVEITRTNETTISSE